MARLPEVLHRELLAENERLAFDYLEKTRGNVRLPFSVLLNHPELCYRIAHVGSFVRFDSSLPRAVTELATLVAAREFDCAFAWADHADAALTAGVSEGAIAMVRAEGDAIGLSDDESLVISYGRELLRDHRVADETYATVL